MTFKCKNEQSVLLSYLVYVVTVGQNLIADDHRDVCRHLFVGRQHNITTARCTQNSERRPQNGRIARSVLCATAGQCDSWWCEHTLSQPESGAEVWYTYLALVQVAHGEPLHSQQACHKKTQRFLCLSRACLGNMIAF
jgi:hypothetical protein